MYHRRLPDYRQKARCAKHGLYPLNFNYRGESFANTCPVCHPTWQAEVKAWREAQLRKHKTDGTTEGES